MTTTQIGPGESASANSFAPATADAAVLQLAGGASSNDPESSGEVARARAYGELLRSFLDQTVPRLAGQKNAIAFQKAIDELGPELLATLTPGTICALSLGDMAAFDALIPRIERALDVATAAYVLKALFNAQGFDDVNPDHLSARARAWMNSRPANADTYRLHWPDTTTMLTNFFRSHSSAAVIRWPQGTTPRAHYRYVPKAHGDAGTGLIPIFALCPGDEALDAGMVGMARLHDTPRMALSCIESNACGAKADAGTACSLVCALAGYSP